jgi:hypothetical protein
MKRFPFPTIYISFFILATVLFSCGAFSAEEIDRISLEEITTKEESHPQTANLNLNAGDRLHIWTETELTFQERPSLEYQLLIIKGADTLALLKMDPEDRDIMFFETTTLSENSTILQFSGRIGKFLIKEKGTYTFSSTITSDATEPFELNKAELIIKK